VVLDHNLPLQVTSFIGRVQEVADIRRELSRTRLLTLAGPGGVGKTRLALRVAEEERAAFSDGVGFVELASLTEQALIPQAVAALFSLRETPQESLIAVLSRTLQSRHVLVILDNCEHVLAACVDLVQRLLRACPRLVILTTSREVFGVGAETVWRVPSLRVHEFEATGPEVTSKTEAIALFAERARAVQPGFAVTPRNMVALSEICRRVDGIPLAIELAASRVSVLTPEGIAERLSSHFGVLASRDPTVEARQQTLENTIRWSYDLLTQDERRLFERLSVFAGGWSFEAMEAVANDTATKGDNMLNTLHRLIDKSLVAFDQAADGAGRYRMLEPLRQYGQDRLRERDELSAVRDRHAAFVLKYFEEAWQESIDVGPTVAWLSRLSHEIDNLRAALRWLVVRRQVDEAQRLVVATETFWFHAARLAEGRRWAEEVFALDPDGAHDRRSEPREQDEPPVAKNVPTGAARQLYLRASVLKSIATLSVAQGDHIAAERAAYRSLRLFDEVGDAFRLTNTYVKTNNTRAGPLLFLGRAATLRADFPDARRFLEESCLLYAQRTSPWWNAMWIAQTYLAEVASEDGHFDEAEGITDDMLRSAKAKGFALSICKSSTFRGELQYRAGQHERARRIWEEALEGVRETNQKHLHVIRLFVCLGRLLVEQDDARRGESLLAEGLMLAYELSRWELARALQIAVEVLGADGEWEDALHVAGTAAAMRDAMGTPAWPSERARLDPVVARTREILDAETADAAWMRGWAAPADLTLTLTLNRLRGTSTDAEPA
jgi:predicted ATPase